MDLSRDTPRQRDLEVALLAHGEPGSWRRLILKLRAEKRSHAEIALYLWQTFRFRADPKTVGNWARQAAVETAKTPGPGAPR